MKLFVIRTIVLASFAYGVSSCDKAAEAVGKAASSLAREKTSGNTAGTPETPVVRALNGVEFDSFITTPDKLVVVDFHADWCGPCKMLAPIIENLAGESGGKVIIGKVDVDKNGPLAAKMGVESIPTVRFFRGGKQIDGFVGLKPKEEIRKLFEKHSAGLPSAGEPPSGKSDEKKDGGKQGTIEPMDKDWMPPGMQKR